MRTKEPWFKFWGADWRNDRKLRRCSSAARGIWIDMITLMHEGVPYGHLSDAEGVPFPQKDLAEELSISVSETKRLLSELEKNGVFSRTEQGVIFSRKMVRDRQKNLFHKGIGSKGASVRYSANHSDGTIVPTIVRIKEDTLVSPSSPIASSIYPLASDPNSGKKNAPAHDNEAVIPTVAEVVEFGNSAAAIDPEFCRYYHAVCCEKQRWMTSFGRPLLWRLEIARWWTARRSTWKKAPAEFHKRALLEEIDAELQWQKDRDKVAALLKKRRELENQ